MKSDKNIIFSVIMPTLNSGKTIKKSLESIRDQSFDQSQVEILVVDGGSSDNTREIAKKFGCKIIENPRVQPECAKHEGVLVAKGKFALFLDSDEVFSSNSALANRLNILNSKEGIKFILTGGYKKPAGFSAANDYINFFSDPFSFYMYNISSDYRHYLSDLKRKYSVISENDKYSLLSFPETTNLPLVDICAGNTFELEFFKRLVKDRINEVNIIPEAFFLIIRETKKAAVLKNDFIYHYSSDSFKKYLKKIMWRVIINLHYTDSVGVGFSNREKYQSKLFRLKKMLFIPYCLTLFLPALISVYYVFKKRTYLALYLFPLTVFTGIYISYQLFLKVIGVKPGLGAYGK